VAWLCPVLDASRLARNGCDWHHLLELCGLFEARVIDLEGVYDPCRPNDKLLLGMKGSISEFELGVLRARMLDAIRAKARRGELRISVPIGYIWLREMGLGFDPDLRIQQVIRLIFARFRELGSARQVLLSMVAEQVHFPRPLFLNSRFQFTTLDALIFKITLAGRLGRGSLLQANLCPPAVQKRRGQLMHMGLIEPHHVATLRAAYPGPLRILHLVFLRYYGPGQARPAGCGPRPTQL